MIMGSVPKLTQTPNLRSNMSDRTKKRNDTIRTRYKYLISDNDGQPMKEHHAMQRLSREYSITINTLTKILFEGTR